MQATTRENGGVDGCDAIARRSVLRVFVAAGVTATGVFRTAQARQKASPAPIISNIGLTEGGVIVPYIAHVPDAVLLDLRGRLVRTKWPDQLPGTRWENGADIQTVRELSSYWQRGYDWRKQEARINRFDQSVVQIDGQRIHFIHQRSSRPDAIPLLLLHGWPGSIIEFAEMIKPLTQPDDPGAPAFHVVVPSLPGFGLSGPTTRSGWDTHRMALAFIVLMNRLGYSKYGVQGGDWGSIIGQHIARQAPERVIGLHVNFLPVLPPTPDALAQLSGEERQRYSSFEQNEAGFFKLQETRPQTPAYALTDSPVGWLAWVAAIFQAGTDNNGSFLNAVDRDAFLTDVTLYWVTGTVGSSMRIYHEENLTARRSTTPASRIDVPVAYAAFPKELIVAPDRWIEPGYNIVQKTVMPRGGHFAALEQPDLLVKDLRTFFDKVKR